MNCIIWSDLRLWLLSPVPLSLTFPMLPLSPSNLTANFLQSCRMNSHLCTFCASSSEVGSPSSPAPSSFYHIVTEIWMVNSVDLLLAWETFSYTAYRTIWFQTKGKMGYVPSIFKYVLNIFKEYFRLHDREGTESCLVWMKERVDKHFVNFSICPCQITSLLTCNVTAVPVPSLPWATIIFSGFVTYTIIFGPAFQCYWSHSSCQETGLAATDSHEH